MTDEEMAEKYAKANIHYEVAKREDEQVTRDVSHRNGKGFTPADAKFLSCLAENYKARKNLTDIQMDHLYKIMPKYANQLINYSIEVGKVYKIGREYRFR